MNRRDWIIATGLCAVAFVLRVPFRSALPYHWDCAEFALAVTDYNIVHSQPHAPGYFLYVMLGRLLNHFGHNPHATFVWLSVVAGSVLAVVVYRLGVQIADQKTGIIAALLLATSPSLWFHSEVALTYIVDALLVCWIVLVCWNAIQRGGTWADAVKIGALLAVTGGIRQQSVPALAPVILYTFWHFKHARFAKLAGAAVVAMALGLAWFVPMIAMTPGGMSAYLEIVKRHAAFNSPATWMGGGADALLWNVFFVGLYCGNGLMLAVLVLPFVRNVPRFLLVWVGGMFVMATMVFFTKEPGYVLNFLPGILLVSALGLSRLRRPAMLAATVAICAANVFSFVAWPSSWDRVFYGRARTAREIRSRDDQLREAVEAIRSHFQPGEVVVCHAGEYLYFGLKQFQWLLPEFEQIQLMPDPTMLTPVGRPLMKTYGGRLEFVTADAWKGRDAIVLLVPPGLTPTIFESYFAPARPRRITETVYSIP